MGSLDEIGKRYPEDSDLNLALKNAKRLYRLVNQLLDFQKLSVGKMKLQLEPLKKALGKAEH